MKQARTIPYLLIYLISALLQGCAGVKLYKDEAITNRSYLRFYYPKTYLLIEKNPATDVIQKSTILYLPDLKNPVYIKSIRGMGSSDFKIDYENGYIKSFGFISDSKIPETITAMGSLAEAMAAFNEMQEKVDDSLKVKSPIDPAKQKQSEWDLYEFIVIDSQISLKKVEITK